MGSSKCQAEPPKLLIQLLGGPVTVYAAWVALICLAPVIAKAVFELYWRIRGDSSELEGGKSA